ncbi:carbamoyl phosphate synthase small subunit [Bacillus aquiflavi]|uniref:Carbamoyl phosphate synthase small chain n=1 Tax=Bacillus aquiflavi TaxID=2672567 RepID=A0A6B3VUA2_9BACI|nr:carbamoyl phosphate synthase small subunit [Bacillus aquiflavi]MBA4537583.1 carbamoyl phosphate synthase small subunit [Bacillus aquiflavi]NEY81840.1 carbamoyl phosphate synthase small subunit [Bacillus aquiflavi]UAC49327.1 carbamoyl phosphate synthase small subunit [Bacillus aquiflavi]
MKRQLILEDGTVFVGEGIGSDTEKIGEVVFNTSMTGYQEILSDPSYCGQIVTFTYPLIGNYGMNRDDFESINPAISGLIVKEAANFPSNWRNELAIDEYLKQKNITGIAKIDTRKLTRIIRKYGTLKGIICSIDTKVEEVLPRLQATKLRNDQVKQVSTKTPYPSPGRGYRVVLVDFGMKHGILRELNKRNCDVIVVPYHTSAGEILNLSPDGVIFSNGPGNPEDVQEAASVINSLLGKVPLFGISLGHQLLALACGAKIKKMKIGHRGASYPVKDLQTGKILFTSQNHGYTVDENSLAGTELEVSYLAVNDGSIEGLKHKNIAAFGVQFNPESSPGSEDANKLFDQFLQMVKSEKQEVL